MAEIVPFSNLKTGSGNGSGPEDPMLDQRVTRLEDDMKDDVKAFLKSIDQKLTDITVRIAEVKGKGDALEGRMAGLDSKIGALPSTWTMLGLVFTTWALGSGILIFAMNFLKR
jgi:hypothetical protein